MSVLLSGAGFSGSFTSYGVTVAVNGTGASGFLCVRRLGESAVWLFGLPIFQRPAPQRD